MLPHVIRHNGRVGRRVVCASWSTAASEHAGLRAREQIRPNRWPTFVAQIARQAGLAGTLGERGVPSNDLPKLAAAATEQWTGTFNPVPMTSSDFQGLYEAAM